MLHLPNRCGGYNKIQLGPYMWRGGMQGCPACLPGCLLYSLEPALTDTADVGHQGLSGMPTTAPPSRTSSVDIAQVAAPLRPSVDLPILVTTLTAACRDKAEFS